MEIISDGLEIIIAVLIGVTFLLNILVLNKKDKFDNESAPKFFQIFKINDINSCHEPNTKCNGKLLCSDGEGTVYLRGESGPEINVKCCSKSNLSNTEELYVSYIVPSQVS